MAKTLRQALRKTTKNQTPYGAIVSIFNGRATVALSGTGAVLSNIPVVGNAVIGGQVLIQYNNGQPMALAPGSTAGAGSSISSIPVSTASGGDDQDTSKIAGWIIDAAGLFSEDGAAALVSGGNPALRLGSSGYALGNGFWAGMDIDGVYKLFVGNVAGNNYLTWSGSALAIRGSVTADSGLIAGWTISTSAITATNISLISGPANTAHIEAGSGANLAGLNSPASGSDIAFWAGQTFTSRASAPFKVTAAGALSATGATISGALTATSGAIGGWTISATDISATNISLISGAANAAHLEVGSGANTAGVNSPAAGGDIAFWSGSTFANRATAPFHVSAAGILTVTGASISGSITASAGTIGGWTVGASSLSATNITLFSGAANTARVEVGRYGGTNYAGINAADLGSDIAFWAGMDFSNRSIAPFRVTALGGVTATNANITGVITANSGSLGTLDVSGIITVGVGGTIRSANYLGGSAGWNIDAAGTAEFENVTVRGKILSSIFVTREIATMAGSMGLFPSAGKLYADFTSLTSFTPFTIDVEDPPGGHTGAQFAVNDILRLKTIGNDNYLKVTVVDTTQTGFYRYTVTLQSGTVATFQAGTAIADYGQSGKGYLFFTADDASNSPYMSVATQAGSPWTPTTGITERVRIGNLRGTLGKIADDYGIAMGDLSAGSTSYIAVSSAGGLVIKGNGSGVTNIDGGNITTGYISAARIAANTITAAMINVTDLSAIKTSTGNLTVTGVLTTDTVSTHAHLEISTTQIAGFAALSGGVPEFSISATDGKAYLGGPSNIYLDKNGIHFNNRSSTGIVDYWDTFTMGRKVYETQCYVTWTPALTRSDTFVINNLYTLEANTKAGLPTLATKIDRVYNLSLSASAENRQTVNDFSINSSVAGHTFTIDGNTATTFQSSVTISGGAVINNGLTVGAGTTNVALKTAENANGVSRLYRKDQNDPWNVQVYYNGGTQFLIKPYYDTTLHTDYQLNADGSFVPLATPTLVWNPLTGVAANAGYNYGMGTYIPGVASVPKAYLVRIAANSSSPGTNTAIMAKRTVSDTAVPLICRCLVSGAFNDAIGVVPCDPSGYMYVYTGSGGTLTNAYIIIFGYFV